MNAGGGADTRCLIVAAAGRDATALRERRQVLRHLVRPVVEAGGYAIATAGGDEPGRISHELLERVIDDDLVVADITDADPAVFYALAVRHAAARPVIVLLADGESMPFAPEDLAVIGYDLHDPDRLEEARLEFAHALRAIEEARGSPRNPVTVARDVVLLEHSDGADLRATGAVLDELRALRGAARRGGRFARADPGDAPPPGREIDGLLADILDDHGPITEAALVEEVFVRTGRTSLDIRPALRDLSHEGRASWNPDTGRWSTGPPPKPPGG